MPYSVYYLQVLFRTTPYILAFLLLVGSVFGIRALWRCLVPPRMTVAAGRCAKCQYDISATTALICPECGADLRIVGVLSRLAVYRLRASLFSAIITFFAFIAVPTGTVLAYLHFSTSMVRSRHLPLSVPISGTAAAIDLWYVESRSSSDPRAKAIIILQRSDGDPWTLEIEHALGSMQVVTDAQGRVQIDHSRNKYVLTDPHGRVARDGSTWDTDGISVFLTNAFTVDSKTEAVEVPRRDLSALVSRFVENQGHEPFMVSAPSISVRRNAADRDVPESVLLGTQGTRRAAFMLIAGATLVIAVGTVLIVRRRSSIIRRLGGR